MNSKKTKIFIKVHKKKLRYIRSVANSLITQKIQIEKTEMKWNTVISLKDVEKASLFGAEPNTAAQSHQPNCDWHNSICDRGAQQTVEQQPREKPLLLNLQVKNTRKSCSRFDRQGKHLQSVT